jgi:hypothetical protein
MLRTNLQKRLRKQILYKKAYRTKVSLCNKLEIFELKGQLHIREESDEKF